MVAKLDDLTRLPNWPRLLSKEQAAAYLGISDKTFLAAVERYEWPGPIRIGSRRLWDRVMLDRQVDQLSGLPAQPDFDAERRTAAQRKKEAETSWDEAIERSATERETGRGQKKVRRR